MSTFTYSSTLATDKDKVRFKIGDTDTLFPQVYDEEIAALLVTYTSVLETSIQCVRFLIGKYSFRANETVGKISVQYDTAVKSLQAKLKDLQNESANSGLGLYGGGISVSDKQSVEDNTDNVKPLFTKEMHCFETDNDE